MSGPYLSRDEVRAFDRHAIETLGIPGPVLMENAGRNAAQILQSLGIRGPVKIACGKGNNGGDGLVMARHLANGGFDVAVHLFANPTELSPDAALEWHIVAKMGLPARIWPDVDFAVAALAQALAGADWIVDALFGTGLAGAVRPPFDHVIAAINQAGARVLAVDIPSGLDCDTGQPLGPCIRADHTVTFVAMKLGFRNPAALAWTGPVRVADIGVRSPLQELP